MCRYALVTYKVHYVCVPCRRSSKHAWDDVEHRCPTCGVAMARAGHDFAAPPRRDADGWAAVAAVLAAGLRYEGFVTCGCTHDPKFRPRTGAQVRARMRLAERDGLTAARALERRDPYGDEA